MPRVTLPSNQLTMRPVPGLFSVPDTTLQFHPENYRQPVATDGVIKFRQARGWQPRVERKHTNSEWYRILAGNAEARRKADIGLANWSQVGKK